MGAGQDLPSDVRSAWDEVGDEVTRCATAILAAAAFAAMTIAGYFAFKFFHVSFAHIDLKNLQLDPKNLRPYIAMGVGTLMTSVWTGGAVYRGVQLINKLKQLPVARP